LRAANLDPSLVQSSPPPPNPCLPPITGITVNSCPSSGAGICVRAPVELSNATLGTTPVCGISVSFQYPFRFWLPFTSLNKQLIYLRASARMRLESQ
jgi:hypothetical protein